MTKLGTLDLLVAGARSNQYVGNRDGVDLAGRPNGGHVDRRGIARLPSRERIDAVDLAETAMFPKCSGRNVGLIVS